MPEFNYKVRDKMGKVLDGQLEAIDGRDLRRKLDANGYFIIDYTEKRSRLDMFHFSKISFNKKVQLNEISVFSWQLYTMLDAGITLIKALNTIITQTENVMLKVALRDVSARVEAGASFSNALSEHPQVFSRLYVQMVNAGEVGGVLDEMLKRLAIYHEHQAEIRSQIKSALTYPAILLTVSISVVIFLVTFVLPRFAVIFDDIGATIPLPTYILLNISMLTKQYWYFFVVGVLVSGLLFRGYLLTGVGRLWFDGLKLSLPGIGNLIRKTLASQFTQTLSILISGGIPIITALDVVIETIGNTVVERALKNVSVQVGEGKSIAQPLGESKIFPDMVVNMIRVGEDTGALDNIMNKVADFYDREIDQAIKAFTKFIEPVLLVFMTVVIGFITVAIFLPLADIMQGLNN